MKDAKDGEPMDDEHGTQVAAARGTPAAVDVDARVRETLARWERDLKEKHKAAHRQRKHEERMENLKHDLAMKRTEHDEQFGLALIGALTPLLQSIGNGILTLQRNSIEAQKARLDAEVLIAEKSPAYAAERVKLHAASGLLGLER